MRIEVNIKKDQRGVIVYHIMLYEGKKEPNLLAVVADPTAAAALVVNPSLFAAIATLGKKTEKIASLFSAFQGKDIRSALDLVNTDSIAKFQDDFSQLAESIDAVLRIAANFQTIAENLEKQAGKLANKPQLTVVRGGKIE